MLAEDKHMRRLYFLITVTLILAEVIAAGQDPFSGNIQSLPKTTLRRRVPRSLLQLSGNRLDLSNSIPHAGLKQPMLHLHMLLLKVLFSR